MIKYDFYSGEPAVGSPGFNVSHGPSPGTEMVYATDPNLRFQAMNNNQNNNFITPGGDGFYNRSPYTAQFGAFQGFQGNPALHYMQNMGYPTGVSQPYQMSGMTPVVQYQDRTVHVPGFNPSGTDGIFPVNIEAICDKLQTEMIIEQEEAIAQRNKRMQGYFNNNFGSNYYGMPYYSSYMDFNVLNKYKQKAAEIRQEAINKRVTFNKNLSRIANSYLGKQTNEEDLTRLYEGYDYVIPGVQQQQDNLQAELSRMKPISNQSAYVKHHNEVHHVMNQMVGQTKDMNDFLRAQGPLVTLGNMEEEMHKRRDASQFYQGDAYRRLLVKSIRDRNNKEGEQVSTPIPNLLAAENFPTLQQSGSILEDGSISITAPPWLGNRQMFVQNEMEKHFEENRSRFLQSIYAQDTVGGV